MGRHKWRIHNYSRFQLSSATPLQLQVSYAMLRILLASSVLAIRSLLRIVWSNQGRLYKTASFEGRRRLPLFMALDDRIKCFGNWNQEWLYILFVLHWNFTYVYLTFKHLLSSGLHSIIQIEWSVIIGYEVFTIQFLTIWDRAKSCWLMMIGQYSHCHNFFLNLRNFSKQIFCKDLIQLKILISNRILEFEENRIYKNIQSGSKNTYIKMHINIYLHLHAHTYIHTHIHIYICVFTHKHTSK